ncbi:MAG: DUF2007 domain-containing protein [Armatimonadota bacterium]|nr:DUF2007 domain-containing protein [bacterium]MDW8320309.1 DUF2007 domain-containing protein [Armatimonadota bacterium]
MRRVSRERWMHLYTAADAAEGNIVLSLLREAGIHAMSRPQGHIYVQWTSPVDIFVPQEELARAQQVLSEAQEAAEPEEGDSGHHGQ